MGLNKTLPMEELMKKPEMVELKQKIDVLAADVNGAANWVKNNCQQYPDPNMEEYTRLYVRYAELLVEAEIIFLKYGWPEGCTNHYEIHNLKIFSNIIGYYNYDNKDQHEGSGLALYENVRGLRDNRCAFLQGVPAANRLIKELQYRGDTAEYSFVINDDGSIDRVATDNKRDLLRTIMDVAFYIWSVQRENKGYLWDNINQWNEIKTRREVYETARDEDTHNLQFDEQIDNLMKYIAMNSINEIKNSLEDATEDGIGQAGKR